MTEYKSSKPVVFLTRPPMDNCTAILQEGGCDVRVWGGPYPIAEERMVEETRGVAQCIMSVGGDPVRRAVIEQAGSQLKVISTISVGVNHIDLDACRATGVTLGHTPGVLTDATANFAVGLLLATSRRFAEGIKAVQRGPSTWGPWSPVRLCGPTLTNATVGIVGLGRIGLATAKRLQAFNISRILYTGHQPKPQVATELHVDTSFVTFDELLRLSDFVIVTCSLNEETHHLFDKEAFSKMKNTAVFINVSRGGIVVQEDLVAALRDGAIAYAGLDVTTPEPLPTDDPLLSLENCLVLPHIASAEVQTRADMCEMGARNALAGLRGEQMVAEYKL